MDKVGLLSTEKILQLSRPLDSYRLRILRVRGEKSVIIFYQIVDTLIFIPAGRNPQVIRLGLKVPFTKSDLTSQSNVI
ncbi:MAG: hypothetical protein MK238_07165, partial [Nitrospinales bacterium]|nr:hypothetical protein [Nitrospinales bacterium]